MATISEIEAEAEFEELAEKKPWLQILAKLIRRQPLGAAGAAIVIAMILTAAFADFITAYDPELNKFEDMLLPMGVQVVGRKGGDGDVLSSARWLWDRFRNEA